MIDALDGNAMAGLLFEIFGTDMTTTSGTCANCGKSSQVAEVLVYLRGPGTVARCRSCSSVLMVFATVGEINCVDLRGLASLDDTRQSVS